MRQRIGILVLALLFTTATALHAQESVCDLFSHLASADGSQLIVTGALIISKDTSVLGAADCDNRYTSAHRSWPAALSLRPSTSVSPDQLQQLQKAAAEADALRSQGKTVTATASFSGRIRVASVGELPAELIFDSFDNLKVAALPDSSSLTVIPICELFQNLASWRGKRVAVRGEFVSTMEGAWIVGECKGGFITEGYRWPVSLTYAIPPYYSREPAKLYEPKWPSPSKGETLQGMFDVIKTATFVGLLRIKSEYNVACTPNGTYRAIGFGHLGGAPGELIVESIQNVELRPDIPIENDDSREQHCSPPDIAALCANAESLARATALGCIDRIREFLAKDGIDSKNGGDSPSLRVAIRSGNEAIVKLLINAGAPVNPAEFTLWPPLTDAATTRHIEIMRLLLQAGAKVDAPDNNGMTVLVSNGFFFPSVTKVLLEAGANVNATDAKGQTALMKASGFGFRQAIEVLIDHHADVNLRDKKGRTALMHAAAGRFSDALPLLLEHGADPNVRDNDGKTAVDLANASNNVAAIGLLSYAMKRSK